MSQLRQILVVVLALTLGGCGEKKSPVELAEVYPTACSAPISVQVTGTTTPSFSWSPACGVTDIRVDLASAGIGSRPLWAITVPENKLLGPAVAYGAAPARASVWSGPQSLSAGQTYRVTVEYVVGGDVVTETGSADFTVPR